MIAEGQEIAEATGKAILLQNASIEQRIAQIISDIRLLNHQLDNMAELSKSQGRGIEKAMSYCRILEGNQFRLVERINNVIEKGFRDGEIRKVGLRRVEPNEADEDIEPLPIAFND